MSSVTDNLRAVLSTLPAGVELVAVSKYHPAEAIQEAYDAGQRIFGESHAQELEDKHDRLPADIQWHFIGHLQTNKVKYIAPYVSLIHSIDSLRLLREVDRQARRVGRRIDCLLQLHIATEETKFGLTVDECTALLESGEWRGMAGVRFCGLMGMASLTDNADQVRSEFRRLSDTFHALQALYFADRPEFRHLSMGMSDDYPLAIREGSNMVRVGSRIFGQRTYNK